jgi:hypothetical protein
VSRVVSKVVGFVNKVSGFIGKVKGFFSKVRGIFSTVKKVFSWIGKKFLALPILGKVGVVLGGIGLVGGAIGGLIWWLRNRKQQQQQQQPEQTPVQNPIPPEILKLGGIWVTLDPAQKTALWPLLKNPASVPFGSVDINVWNTLTLQQNQALTPYIQPSAPGVPDQYNYLFT